MRRRISRRRSSNNDSESQNTETGTSRRRRRRVRVSDAFIDTVTFTASLDSIEVAEILRRASDFNECFRIFQRRNGYEHNFNIWLDNQTRDSLLIQLSLRGDGTSFRCEFHPQHGNLWLAQNWLEELMPNGYLGLLTHCYVTRLDLTVDIINKGMEDLLIWYPNMRTNRIFAGQNGLTDIQSVYSGSRRSNRHLLLYDRTAYLRKRNRENNTRFDVPRNTVTRLEFRNKEARTFHEVLTETTNPFERLRIYDLSRATNPSTELRLFFDSCRYRGCNASLTLMSAEERANYLSMIPENLVPNWWNPESLWVGWGNSISALIPDQDMLIGISDFPEDVVGSAA